MSIALAVGSSRLAVRVMGRKRDEELYRSKILLACCQSRVLPFDQCFPPTVFPRFVPLDKGSYSVVLRAEGASSGKDFVFKMIKLKARKHFKSEVDNSEVNELLAVHYAEAFQELVIAKNLSNLHATMCNSQGHEYRAHCFPKVFRASLVNKVVPLEKGPIFVGSQEFASICMEDCGESLRSCYRKLTLKQIASVCYQVLLGLAAAEALFEYEHRDLHLGNIMIRPTQSASLNFMVASKQYRVDTEGKRAFIIDNTFARMRIGRDHFYTNLTDRLANMAKDAEDPTKSQSDQDKVYVGMFHSAQGNWAKWMASTNLDWLNFLMRRMLKGAQVNSEEDKSILQELQALRQRVQTNPNLQSVLKAVYLFSSQAEQSKGRNVSSHSNFFGEESSQSATSGLRR